jgi:hypothetical protein
MDDAVFYGKSWMHGTEASTAPLEQHDFLIRSQIVPPIRRFGDLFVDKRPIPGVVSEKPKHVLDLFVRSHAVHYSIYSSTILEIIVWVYRHIDGCDYCK